MKEVQGNGLLKLRRWWLIRLLLCGALSVAVLAAGCERLPTELVEPEPEPEPVPGPGTGNEDADEDKDKDKDEDEGTTQPDLHPQVTGRLERGMRIALNLADPAPPAGAPVSWTAEPVDAIEFLAGDTARLLRAGSVTITATSGERSGQISLEVAAPPTVVFEMVRNGNRDIYRAALDGGDLVRLTSGQHDNRAPTVANGRVVFTSYRDGNGELYSVPLAGGAETRLTRTPAHETDPALAPDGKRLAYTSTASGVPKLWTAAADAGGAARATTGFGLSGAFEAAPSWAPDGERIVFVSTTLGTADLFIYTPATGAIESLLVTDAPEVEPAWSPDGEWVAFASARAGRTDLYRIRVGLGAVEQLTDRAEADARPAWLADGRIVYLSWVGGVPQMRWLDPAEPATVHEIPLGAGTIGRVVGVW